MTARRHIVVGGGQAGLAAVAKLRELDSTASITLVGEEAVLPYQRPPLSKAYLSGKLSLDRLELRPSQWFEDNDIELIFGARAKTVDADGQTLTLADGRTLGWERLLIATGSTPRSLPDAMGGNLKGVHTLRHHLDADAMRPALKPECRLIVIGGGFIGLEVAAVAAEAGLNVTIVEMAERILNRVAAPVTSDFYRTLHQSHGVTVLEGVRTEELVDNGGQVVAVRLNDGSEIPADLVLAGIGVLPNTSLAETAGLDVTNGIVVDSLCRTSVDNIFAAGDCANFPYRGGRVRLESVPNAIHQAEVAAANMAGHATDYAATPWFWSDQYDVKLQIAGLNTGYTETVVREGAREGTQSIWYYGGDQLLAVDAMNDPVGFMVARRILEAEKSVPKAVVADRNSNLKDWI